MPWLDRLLFAWSEVIAGVAAHVERSGLVGILLLGFPLFLLCEVPRYGVPAVMVLLRRWRHRPPPDAGGDLPPCSVLIVGYNEAEQMPTAIARVLASDAPIDEIVVVDDGSEDGTAAAVASSCADPRLKVYRNGSDQGRGGRPAASNMALAASRNELAVSVDADTRVEPACIGRMLAAFDDERVGAVAGCLVVDRRVSLLASLQAIDFLIAFGMHRCWLEDLRMSIMASGALGAFRRQALEQVGGWDAELAEDADLSTKIRKAGWELRFVPQAVAETDVPATWGALLRQRRRWDRGFVRTFFRKHRDILYPWRYGWRRSGELLLEGFLALFCGLLLPVYLIWMLLVDPQLLVFILLACIPLYSAVVLLALIAALTVTERWRADWPLLLLVPVYPVYGWILRAARLWSYILELLRIDYEDPFLPASAWRNAPRW